MSAMFDHELNHAVTVNSSDGVSDYWYLIDPVPSTQTFLQLF